MINQVVERLARKRYEEAHTIDSRYVDETRFFLVAIADELEDELGSYAEEARLFHEYTKRFQGGPS